MKRIGFLLFLFLLIFHLGSCDNTTTSDSTQVHSHEYTEKVTTEEYLQSEATCESPAKYYYSCSCGIKGENTFENGETLPHNFDQQVTTEEYLQIEATCTSKATYYYSCGCGEKGSETFEYGWYNAHTYTNKVTTEEYLQSEATCESPAKYYYSCSCGKEGYLTFEYGSKVSHEYTEKVTTEEYLQSEATCESPAKYYYSCSCGIKGENTFENGETLPHNFDQQVTTEEYLQSEATCESPAKYYYSCSCGKEGYLTFEYGSKVSHEYTEKVTTEEYLQSEATCESPAKYYYSCECGEKGSETFNYDTRPHNLIEENKVSEFNTPYVYIHCKDCEYYDFLYNESYLMAEYKKYGSTSMVDSFSTFENGESMVQMYREALANGLIFTFDNNIDVTNDIFLSIDYSKYGLSLEEGQTIWSAIESDWPLFYWMDNRVYCTDTSIIFYTIEEFYDGDSRTAVNAQIFKGIEDLLAKLEGKTRLQQIYTLHEEIILNTDYAYDENNNPSEELHCYTIYGYFNNKNVVCEGYAKTTQIILNLLGIENLYVTGYAGEDHAWNMVKVYEDWYMLDVTWDDRGNYASIEYFLTYDDGSHIAGENTLGLRYQYETPAISSWYYIPVTLYYNDNLVGVFGNIATAFEQMTDENGKYTIYLYDNLTDEYFRCDDTGYYIDPKNIPVCKELTFIGNLNTDYNVEFFITNEDDNVKLSCDLYFKNLKFPDSTNPINFLTLYTDMNLNGHTITFDSCKGGLFYNFYGEGTSTINVLNCSGLYNTDSIIFLGNVEIPKIYCYEAVAQMYSNFNNFGTGNFIVEKVELDSGGIEFITENSHNPTTNTLNVVIGEITGGITLRYRGDGETNVTINKMSCNARGGFSMYTDESLNSYPKITINEYVTDTSNKTFVINLLDLNENTFQKVKDELMYIYTDTKFDVLYENHIGEYCSIKDNGAVSCGLRYDGDFLVYDNILVKYIGNDYKVEIPDYITTIKTQCFDWAPIISLTLPVGLTTVDFAYINGCSKLIEIINKSNMSNEHLLNMLTGEKEAIKFVETSNLDIRGDYVFTRVDNELILVSYLGSETNVVLPTLEETYSLGNKLFYNNTTIETISIPTCVTKIGSYVFAGTTITEIVIPEGVKEIGSMAFENAYELSKISLPSTLEKLDSYTFYNTVFKEIILAENKYYSFKNNCLFDERTKTVIKAVDGASVPSDTEIIAMYAYYQITLSDWILPDSLREIHNNAFSYTNIDYLVVPKNVQYIEGAFGLSSLKKIEFLCEIETLSLGLFFDCKNLQEVILPGSIKVIEDSTFYHCSSLTNVYFKGSIDSWQQITFVDEYSNPLKYAQNLYVYVDGEYVLYTQ